MVDKGRKDTEWQGQMGRKTGAQKTHKERVGKEVIREKKFKSKGKEWIEKVGTRRKLKKKGGEVTAAPKSMCAPSWRNTHKSSMKHQRKLKPVCSCQTAPLALHLQGLNLPGPLSTYLLEGPVSIAGMQGRRRGESEVLRNDPSGA